jgi:hypothetical protein
VAGFVAAQKKHDVSLLTRHPERWSQSLTVELPSGTTCEGHLNGLFSDAKQAVSNADIILLCLPGYAIRETLLQIRDYLKPCAAVGSVVSSTGFFFEALELLPFTQPLFGFQRVPFIARTQEYGHRARLMGYKESLSVAVEQTVHKEELRQMLEAMTALKKQRILCTVVTSMMTYKDMLLTEITATQDEENQYGWSGELAFMEYIPVTEENAQAVKENNNSSVRKNTGSTGSSKKLTGTPFEQLLQRAGLK